MAHLIDCLFNPIDIVKVMNGLIPAKPLGPLGTLEARSQIGSSESSQQ